MKKIAEHYYTITKDEVTPEMELIEEGMYCINEDFYEILDITKEKPIYKTIYAQQESSATHHKATKQPSYRKACFVLAIVLLSMTVLFLYLGISNIHVYIKGIEQLTSTSQTSTNPYNDYYNQIVSNIESSTREQLDKRLKKGILWTLGGTICFLFGIGIAYKYDCYLQRC